MYVALALRVHSCTPFISRKKPFRAALESGPRGSKDLKIVREHCKITLKEFNFGNASTF